MPSENVFETDVLVIGGGIAGCFAAIKAKEQGVDVILVDKGYVGRAGQTPYARGYMAFNPEWGHDLDTWMSYISRTGEYVNNRDWTEITIKESYARYLDLVAWGVTFQKGEDGEPVSRPMTEGGTVSLQFEGRNFPMIMRKQARKIGVKIIDRIMIAELLKQDGRIVGSIGIPVESSELYIFNAKTTIMCVGACGFKPAGYPPLAQLTADGESMAYRAGAEITGKEFVDTHFTRVEDPSIIGRMQAPRGRGDLVPDRERSGGAGGSPGGGPRRPPFANLFNSEGNKISDRPAGTSPYPFTYLQLEFEAHAGHGPMFSHYDSGDRYEMVGGATLGMSVRKAEGIWPADSKCASNVQGLYAAGDALGNMQNGTVYASGGGSLAGSAVTGTRAGVAAAAEAKQIEKPKIDEKELSRAKNFVLAPMERKGGFSPRWATQILQNTLMPYFIMFIKKEDRMQAALTMVEFLRDHIMPKLFARDRHELRLALETKNMVLNAEMRLRSSIFRTESRGNHYREDYPRRDDPGWLAWVKIKEEEGGMKLYKVPIPEKWWPDLSKPYEELYPFRLPNE
ncbi:MAG: FAD-binding protein [Deltaproteobacteria bacterium]|nr:FAD-binding protein [Deltaproteobacteria bacterium]